MFWRSRAAARWLAPAVLCLAAIMMAGCSDKPVPPCPEVRVDRDTEQLVKFADAGRQDLSDVDYGVEIVGYQGVCKYKNRKIKSKDRHSHEVTVRREVQVTMNLTMDLVRGPAAKERTVSIPYFIALPDFFPKPAGKRNFTVTRELPAHPGVHERIVEKDLRVTIPLRGDEPGAAYEVYVGFQLTPDQVAFNRSQHSSGATE